MVYTKLQKIRKKRFSKENKEYDINGRLVYYKDRAESEMFMTYENGKQIHCKKKNGTEYWRDYDENGNLIHYKSSDGFEYWKEYDENNNCVHYRNSKGVEEFY